jgi:hypothetical protein
MQKGISGTMKKSIILIISLTILAMLFSSCILDPKEKKKKEDDPVEVVWPDLTEKDHVFEYLELVYEKRNYNRYEKLLDDNFNFRFGDDDYNTGKTDRDWGRTSDLNSANKMLNSYSHPQYGAVVQIDLTIQPEGTNWLEIPKTDPPFTGETWYQKSFRYWLTASTNTGMELRGHDINAFFIVRQSELEGVNIFRIVQWNDDTGP